MSTFKFTQNKFASRLTGEMVAALYDSDPTETSSSITVSHFSTAASENLYGDYCFTFHRLHSEFGISLI